MRTEEEDIAKLQRSLVNAKRRMRFWSGMASFSSRSPKQLNSSEMERHYGMAVWSARSLAEMLALKHNIHVKVIDVKETYRARYFNKNAPEVLVYPKS